MAIDLTIPEIAKLRACSDCVDESHLSSEIRRWGIENACSYCKQTGKTYSIDQLADELETALRDHYYLTRSEPDLIEYHMWMDDEVSYEWRREGEPVAEVIAWAAEVDEEIAEDIRRVLEERHDDFEQSMLGNENPFDSEAYYAEREIDDAESQASWLHFEESLTTEARYFNPSAEATLTSTFSDIAQHKTHEDAPVIVEVGPGKTLAAFYRARTFQSTDKLLEALERPDRGIGPPPSPAASAGRMNPHGVSVFYGATDPVVALAEVRPPVGSRVVVARFDALRILRLLDIEALLSLNVDGSIFDKTYGERLQKAKFLGWLSARITQPVMPNDEAFDYLPTQVIADFLATRTDPELDGILYPAVQGKKGEHNVVLFHKSSRVEELDIPSETEFSVDCYRYTEEGQEISYWVTETVNRTEDSETRISPSGSNTNLLFVPSKSSEPENYDPREVMLKIDLQSLRVHHVHRVDFATENYQVSRHRTQKTD